MSNVIFCEIRLMGVGVSQAERGILHRGVEDGVRATRCLRQWAVISLRHTPPRCDSAIILVGERHTPTSRLDVVFNTWLRVTRALLPPQDPRRAEWAVGPWPGSHVWVDVRAVQGTYEQTVASTLAGTRHIDAQSVISTSGEPLMPMPDNSGLMLAPPAAPREPNNNAGLLETVRAHARAALAAATTASGVGR